MDVCDSLRIGLERHQEHQWSLRSVASCQLGADNVARLISTSHSHTVSANRWRPGLDCQAKVFGRYGEVHAVSGALSGRPGKSPLPTVILLMLVAMMSYLDRQ